MKTVYIAGPMRGHPEFNFPAFDRTEEKLRERGYNPINPAALDREAGFDQHASLDEKEIMGKMREFLKRDLQAICECDAIALLPGWEESEGANVEYGLAKLLKLEIIIMEDE